MRVAYQYGGEQPQRVSERDGEANYTCASRLDFFTLFLTCVSLSRQNELMQSLSNNSFNFENKRPTI